MKALNQEANLSKGFVFGISIALVLIVAAMTLLTSFSGGTPAPKKYAGLYGWGNGYGWAHWDFFENGRFEFVRGGCTGVTEHDWGDYNYKNGQIILEAHLTDYQTWKPAKKKLHFFLVEWGKRTYLLEERELHLFVAFVNEGKEPVLGHTRFMMKNGDEKEVPTGIPTLPLPWRAGVLAAPLQVTVKGLTPDGNAVLLEGQDVDLLNAGMKLYSQDIVSPEWGAEPKYALVVQSVLGEKVTACPLLERYPPVGTILTTRGTAPSSPVGWNDFREAEGVAKCQGIPLRPEGFY